MAGERNVMRERIGVGVIGMTYAKEIIAAAVSTAPAVEHDAEGA